MSFNEPKIGLKVPSSPKESSSSSSSSNSSSDNERDNESRRLHDHRILICEDFDLTSSFLSNTLKYCRAAHCSICKSGEEALALISESGKFDLIITDVMMKGIGGVEFIKRVRILENEKNWKPQIIIAMSADEANSESAMAAGSNLFLFKYSQPMAHIFSVLDSIRSNSSSAAADDDTTITTKRRRQTIV